MSMTVGQRAIIRRIISLSVDVNISLPNGAGADLPRYVIQASGGGQRTATIDGKTDSLPEIVVRVETEADGGATQNDDLVANLVAMFPVSLRFDNVTVLEAPQPRPAIPGTGAYSVPVIVRGRYSF